MKLVSLKKEITHFFNSALHIHGGTAESVEIIKPDVMISNITRIRYGDMELLIQPKGMKEFERVLQSLAPEDMQKMAHAFLSTQQPIYRIQPIMPLELISIGEIDDNDPYWNGAMGVNFMEIDKRFDKLFNVIKNDFEVLARLLTSGASLYNKDNTKPKVTDVYFFINTDKTGKEVNFFLTATDVKPIDEFKEIEPNRSPMGDYELDLYFNYPSANINKAENGITIRDEIEATLERINKRIAETYDISDAKTYPVCKDLLDRKINSILIPVVVTMRLAPYSNFGDGVNAIDLAEGESANAIAVGEIIDKEIIKIIDHLKSIPIKEDSNIDHYAMDTDSFGIYGCDDKNELIEAMVEPKYMFANVFQIGYSDGFLRKLSTYIKTIKNSWFFSTNGKSLEKARNEATDEQKLKAADDLVKAWKNMAIPPVVIHQIKQRLEEDGIDLSSVDLETGKSTDEEVSKIIDIILMDLAYKACGVGVKSTTEEPEVIG